MKYSSVVVGKGQGSLGNVTASSAYGIPYLKQKAEKVSNPQTPAQMAQRYAMALCTLTAQQIANFIDIAYKAKAINMSTKNQFTSQNLVQSKMNIDMNAGLATWLPRSLTLMPNPSQTATSNAGVANNQLAGTVSGLVATRNYNVYLIGQDTSGNIGAVVKQVYTADSQGEIDVLALANAFNLNALDACYYSVQDTVTGKVSNFTALA